MTERVPEVIARERADRVGTAAESTMERRARSLVGTELEVLVERFDRDEQAWFGRSHREAPEVDGEIRLELPEAPRVGDYVSATVTANDGADLWATSSH